MKTILGQKIGMKQIFSKEGERFSVTEISTGPCKVVFERSKEKDGYQGLGLAFGNKKSARREKKDQNPLFLKEVRIEAEDEKIPVGEEVFVEKIFQPGDLINATGISKGLGFTGVVKRHHFKGGPKTHGQSDRQRAPGSIGSTTTPGRVMKGKRMAGKEGGKQRTIKNLRVMTIDGPAKKIFIQGSVPGKKDGFLLLKKVGGNNNFKKEIIAI